MTSGTCAPVVAFLEWALWLPIGQQYSSIQGNP